MSEDRQPPGSGATADLLAEMFESAHVGLAILRGRDLVIDAANEAFEALAPGTPLVGRAAAAVFPELSGELAPVALGVLETGEPQAIRDLCLRLPEAEGEPQPRYFTICLRRLEARDGEARLWVALMETTARVRAGRRAELLASFSTGLNSNPDISVVVQRTLRRAVALLGARYGALWLLDPDGWTLRAKYGRPLPDVRQETFDLRTLPTFQRALQSRVAVFATRDDLAGAEAELFRRLEISGGIVAPLAAGGRDLGLLTMSFMNVGHRPDDDELVFATGLAAQGALAIERARALEEARRANAAVEASQVRLRLLADVGGILSTALDWDTAVHATTRVAVGRLADWAILDVVRDDGGLDRESVRCGPPSARPPAWSPDRLPPGERDPALSEAIDAKRTRQWDLTALDEEGQMASPHLASLRDAGAGSAIVAPLVARRRALGVLTLARAAGAPPYDREDVSLMQDLATRIAFALQDARLLRALERSAEARGDILAMARHELRTPLTALKLELGQLARATPEDERTVARVRALERATDRLTRAVEQLLDIAHIGGGGDLTLHRSPIDLVAVAAETVARVSPELARVGCSVKLVAPAALPTVGDRLRIRGLIHHLLDHAARLGSGRPIDLVLATRHGRPTLTVRYRGEPIPPGVRERLAAPLERHTRRLSLADVELGLWISRWIVEAHGGRLVVRPTEDGAAFVAELPGDGAGPAVA